MNTQETYERLVSDNHNLIYSFLHHYNLSIDDYYDLAAIGLCEAAKRFDADKAKFSVFAYRCMFTSVLQDMRAKKMQKAVPEDRTVSYNKHAENENGDKLSALQKLSTGENIENEIILKMTIEKYFATCKKDKYKKIIRMHLDGYKQKEIAVQAECSRVHVSRVILQFEEYIRKEYLCSDLSRSTKSVQNKKIS